MKDECSGKIMTEFMGIRSKLYNIQIQGQEKSIMKAKGVKGCVVKSMITSEDFRKCLFENQVKRVFQCNIRSKAHTVVTERGLKVALSPFDEKRYLIPGSTDTLPWGHYNIPKDDDDESQEEEEEEEEEINQDDNGEVEGIALHNECEQSGQLIQSHQPEWKQLKRHLSFEAEPTLIKKIKGK